MGMRQIFCVGTPSDGANPPSSGVRYFNPVQTWSVDATEANREVPWMVAGTFRNLVVTTPTDPGGTASWTFTLRKNGVDTALTCTISAGSTSARDTANDVTFAEGDILSMSVTPTNTPSVSGTTGEWQLSIEFECSGSKENGYAASPLNVNATSTVRNGVFAGYTWTTNAGTTTHNVVAAPGALKAARVRLTGSPGVGKNYTFNLYKNGVKQDGAGGTVNTTITIADNATSGDWTGTLTLAAGDTVYWECVPSGTPTLRAAGFGLRFLSDVNGQSQWCGLNVTTINTVNNVYSSPESRDDDWDTSEASNDARAGVETFSLSKLYVVLGGDPTPGEYNFSYRRNTTSPVGTPSATVTAGNTTASDLVNFIDITDGDIFTIRADPNSSPTARAAAWASIQVDPTAPIASDLVHRLSAGLKARLRR